MAVEPEVAVESHNGKHATRNLIVAVVVGLLLVCVACVGVVALIAAIYRFARPAARLASQVFGAPSPVAGPTATDYTRAEVWSRSLMIGDLGKGLGRRAKNMTQPNSSQAIKVILWFTIAGIAVS